MNDTAADESTLLDFAAIYNLASEKASEDELVKAINTLNARLFDVAVEDWTNVFELKAASGVKCEVE